MPAQTETVIRAIEEDAEIRAMAIAQIMGLMQRELELRETLEEALHQAGIELPSGWVDWEDVIAHFRRRAVEGIIRDELRRNQLAGHRLAPGNLASPEQD